MRKRRWIFSAPHWRRRSADEVVRFHDPASPRLRPVYPGDVSRNRIIREAVKACESIFYDRHSNWQELHWRFRGRSSKRKGVQRRRVFVKRKRSDSAEAQAVTFAFFVSHADLRTSCVGAWRNGKIAFYDLDRIAQCTGLSPTRLDRALNALNAAGLLWARQEHEQVALHDGQVRWSSFIAVRGITPKGFARVGISAEQRAAITGVKDRERAAVERKAERKAEHKAERVELLERDPQLAAMLVPERHLKPEDRPAFEALCWRIERERHGWNHAEVAAEAMRRLYPPGPPGSR